LSFQVLVQERMAASSSLVDLWGWQEIAARDRGAASHCLTRSSTAITTSWYPRAQGEQSRRGEPTSVFRGHRSNSPWNAARASSRARDAPRQKWGPTPNPRCREPGRSRLKLSGYENSRSSRFAAPHRSITGLARLGATLNRLEPRSRNGGGCPSDLRRTARRCGLLRDRARSQHRRDPVAFAARSTAQLASQRAGMGRLCRPSDPPQRPLYRPRGVRTPTARLRADRPLLPRRRSRTAHALERTLIVDLVARAHA
jgi:hypothetical protein